MKNKKTKIYVCGTDWRHELGDAWSNTVYGSEGSLKKSVECWKGCGIVELDVSFSRVVVEEDWEEQMRTAVPAGELTKVQIAQVEKKIKGYQTLLEKLKKDQEEWDESDRKE